ncbi:murein DD-endopeptidase MepM/ murein hydrolase activator NlpD [Sinomonas atrocyanea]|uniref:M23 family metallopeptidase n=1 Tax=Sinomonas atrocyanea TaxID=37927 RepID=UPI00277F2CA4|nr:M23 family metallopeptidase [Sinomonas atrocyanea]MDP9883467.1 murein DD-endopeptidase MepM/ murein hydrolase activator NlpD [Sinomonas atrocyanea]
MDTAHRPARPPVAVRLAAALALVAALLAPLGPATAAALPPLAGPAAEAGWTWPLEPRPAVARPFDPPARPWLSGHRGVDLAAAPGMPVRAPQAGRVSFSGRVVDRPVVTIDHGGGLRSSFEPVEATVPVGSAVARGEEFGVLSASGAVHCADGACLHWGVRRGDDYVDPLAFIEDRRPSVLLPWEGPP